jgi:hypothetical protein
MTGMDTTTTPHISPALEPETMTALALRYVEDNEEVAYRYAHALVSTLADNLGATDALLLTRNIITEITNNIREFEGEEVTSQIDVALRRLIDHVEAELAG